MRLSLACHGQRGKKAKNTGESRTLFRQIFLGLFCFLSFLCFSTNVLSRPAATPQPTVTSAVSTTGPFQVRGKKYLVRVVTEKVHSASSISFGETVSRYEILNASGNVHFAEDFPFTLYPDGFGAIITLEAYRLRGATGEGIILFQQADPSAPGTGRSFRVFGRRGAVLEPFSAWLHVDGTIKSPPMTKAGTMRLIPGDVVEISVWTGWFGVVVPLTIDLERGVVRIPEGSRTYPVEAEGPDFHESPGGVRLFAAPSPDAGFVTVPVTRTSKIEYVEVRTSAWLTKAAGEEGGRDVAVEEMPWLRIRVDGKEGWIREVPDLLAVGLSPAG